MWSAIPKQAIKLGVVERDLDHFPGMAWRIAEHYHPLLPRGQKHDWVLVGRHLDDDGWRYEWSQDAVGAGFTDGKAAGWATAAAFLKGCNFDLDDDDYTVYRDFLERV